MSFDEYAERGAPFTIGFFAVLAFIGILLILGAPVWKALLLVAVVCVGVFVFYGVVVGFSAFVGWLLTKIKNS